MNKAQVLSIIQNAPGVIVGQHVGNRETAVAPNWPYNFTHEVTDLYTLTGKFPAIVAASLEGNDDGYWKHTGLINLLIDEWNAGSLIELTSTINNPWTGEDESDLTRTRLADLLIPGDPHDAYIAQIDFMHSQLVLLRDAGVVVLWRPFREMTYTQSTWWCVGNEWWEVIEGEYANRPQIVADFIALWQDMYTRFADCPNLIWVYGAANSTGAWGGIPCDSLWPGNTYVDIAGFSYYDQLTEPGITELAAHGKPIAFTEFGHIPRDGTDDLLAELALLKLNPLIKYVLHWQSWGPPSGWTAIIDQVNPIPYMNDAYILTRDEILLPTAPSALVAEAVSQSQINLAWRDNSYNEIGFKIERSLTGIGDWVQIATVTAGVVAYSNIELERGTTYYYRVCAYN